MLMKPVVGSLMDMLAEVKVRGTGRNAREWLGRTREKHCTGA